MLKHVEGRIIVKVDIEQKNNWTFSDGTTIRLERNFDNLDKKYTSQVLGEVIDADSIPAGALLLFHHNSVHETYEIHNHSQLSGSDIATGIKIYSIVERDCFFWKMPNENTWHPTKGYATALRVFKPYKGVLENIAPKQIKDHLYVTSGELEGKIVTTLKSCDYMITFRDVTTGQDKQIIRFRPFGIESDSREEEAICIRTDLTEQLYEGKLLIGLTPNDAKQLQINAYAD